MIIYNRIDECIKNAMLSKDMELCEVFRSIKCAFQNHETAKNAKPIDETIEIEILKRLRKQAYESAEIFKQENRMDLFTKRNFECEVLDKLIPVAPSDEELIYFVKTAVSEIEKPTMKDMGLLIKKTKEVFPSADGKTISTIVNEMLRAVI